MDDAVLVGGRQRVGDLRAEIERLLEEQRPFAQPVREGLALEQLHHEEVDRRAAGRLW